MESNNLDTFRISTRLIDDAILKPRYLLLLETQTDYFVALRVVSQQLSFISYDFVADAGISALTGVGTTGQIAQHVQVKINNLSIQDALSISTAANRTDNIMQIFYGIAPSYVYVDLEVPGGTYLNQLPNTALNPQSTYPYLYGHSGFDSPYYEPSRNTEFFSVSNLNIQFTLQNSVSISVNPRMLFAINNTIVKPVNDISLFKAMLERKVPVTIANMNQIYTSVTWSPALYSGVSPILASSILKGDMDAFREAGYGVK